MKIHGIKILTLKAPVTAAADDKFFDIFSNFRKKIRHEITYESSASRQISCFVIFEKASQLKLSSAAKKKKKNRWRFKD